MFSMHEFAVLTGFVLEPPTEPNLFSIIGADNLMSFIIVDIRNLDMLENAKPEEEIQNTFREMLELPFA